MKNKKIKFLNACLGIGLIGVTSCCMWAANTTTPTYDKFITKQTSSENVTNNSVLSDTPKAWPTNAIPREDLDIDTTTNTLQGIVTGASISSYTVLYIPKEITSISKRAFDGQFRKQDDQNDLEVVFEESNNISTLESYSFNSSYITKLDLSNLNELSLISGSCFHGCRYLTQVIFPKNLKIINGVPFSGCERLTIVDFSKCDDFKGIYYTEAFGNCYNLANVTLPNGIEVVTGFESCSKLSHVDFPSTVKYINTSAFNGCNLSELDLSKCSNLKMIDEWAFHANHSLESVIFPSNLQEIRDRSFWGCSSLIAENIKIPASVKYIGEFAFDGISSNTSFSYTCSGQGLNVWCLGNVGNSDINVTTLEINEGTYGIVPSAFGNYGNINCSDIIFPSTIEVLGKLDFSNFNSAYLSLGNLPKLKNIEGINNFLGDSISLPGSMESIEISGLSGCKGLTTLDLSQFNNLKYIGPFAFQQCSKLSSIIFPSSLEIIGSEAFCEDNRIEELDFSSCINMKEIVNNFNDYDTSYDHNYYDGLIEYTSVKSVKLPSSLTNIGEYAFSKYIWSTSHETTDYEIFNFSNLVNLKKIEGGAFYGENSFSKIDLSHCYNLTQLSDAINYSDVDQNRWVGSFDHCFNVTSILLPRSLDLISYHTFNAIPILNEVYLPWDKNQFGSKKFNVNGIEYLPLVSSEGTIHIPKGTTEEQYIKEFGDDLPSNYIENVNWKSDWTPDKAPVKKTFNLYFILMIAFGALTACFIASTVAFGIKSLKHHKKHKRH